ncbi:DUF6046 domain-containing protein [Pseudotenacibaculum haliotis]|uniref:DUF6046 domain-containing protein n=1 Tax=Pseudotenacibaculum haliotis TaxID=1862138 RepID=A0ABW5LQJ9_9FLAO
MSKTNYNLQELFRVAFGKTDPVYTTDSVSSDQKKNIAFTGVTVQPKQKAERMSWLGTPILFPVLFKGGTYQEYLPNGQITEVVMSDFYLPAATLVDFRREKNITETPVLGDDGTVKEIFGFGDWKIRIKGLCLDEPGSSALDQITEILTWENLIGSIQISGELFSKKDIGSIVIKSIEVPQVQGKPGVIPFTINAISDKIIELLA